SDHPYSYATSVLFLQSPPRPPSPTPFPYTTLFRYREQHHHGHGFPRRGVLPQGHVAARRERRALDAVVESAAPLQHPQHGGCPRDRKSTRLNSSHVKISYAVFCLKKKKKKKKKNST